MRNSTDKKLYILPSLSVLYLKKKTNNIENFSITFLLRSNVLFTASRTANLYDDLALQYTSAASIYNSLYILFSMATHSASVFRSRYETPTKAGRICKLAEMPPNEPCNVLLLNNDV